MIWYFDRDGEPITQARWSELFHDLRYRIVAQDNFGDLWVSTVWIGIDLNIFDRPPPLIFETMVFHVPQGDDAWDIVDMARYATVAQAKEGHARMVEAHREEGGER